MYVYDCSATICMLVSPPESELHGRKEKWRFMNVTKWADKEAIPCP